MQSRGDRANESSSGDLAKNETHAGTLESQQRVVDFAGTDPALEATARCERAAR